MIDLPAWGGQNFLREEWFQSQTLRREPHFTGGEEGKGLEAEKQHRAGHSA